ncbi:MAG: hypothetical protein ACRD88_07415 [Terriglobia bacterium]
MAQCPECEAFLDLEADEVTEGEIIACPECGVDLEVVNINPVEIRLLEEEELDEDDEDDEEKEELDEDEEEYED